MATAQLQELTRDDVIARSPAVGATSPSDRVSSKYSFIPTSRTLDDFDRLGWTPRASAQTRGNHLGFHVIRLRPKHVTELKVQDSYPEIVLSNAHDGTAAFVIRAGVFRLVCSNGMVVPESLFQTIRIKHINYSYEAVSEAIELFLSRLNVILDKIEVYRGIDLTPEEREAFARRALEMRFGITPDAKQISSALRSRRSVDSSPTLWHTFNAVQENLIKGGVFTPNGRRARAIKSAKADIEVNTGLFTIAEQFANVRRN